MKVKGRIGLRLCSMLGSYAGYGKGLGISHLKESPHKDMRINICVCVFEYKAGGGAMMYTNLSQPKFHPCHQ